MRQSAQNVQNQGPQVFGQNVRGPGYIVEQLLPDLPERVSGVLRQLFEEFGSPLLLNKRPSPASADSWRSTNCRNFPDVADLPRSSI